MQFATLKRLANTVLLAVLVYSATLVSGKETPTYCAGVLAESNLDLKKIVNTWTEAISKAIDLPDFVISNTVNSVEISDVSFFAITVIVPSEYIDDKTNRWIQFDLNVAQKNENVVNNVGQNQADHFTLKVTNLSSVKRGLNNPFIGMATNILAEAESNSLKSNIQNKYMLIANSTLATESPQAIGDAAQLISAIEGVPDRDLDTLLSCGLNPNTFDAKGRTPLAFAAERKDLNAVLKLLEYNANANFAQTSAGRGAGSPESPLQALIGTTYPLESPNPNKLTNCEYTVKIEIQITSALLNSGANVEGDPKKSWSTPLGLASYVWPCSPVELMQLLKDNGADVNAVHVAATNSTPLETALKYGTYEAVKWLVENGAGLETVGTFGNTPLFSVLDRSENPTKGSYMCKNDSDNDQTAIFRLLIDNGANVLATNADGETLTEYMTTRIGQPIEADCISRMNRHVDPKDRPALLFESQ